MANPCSEMSITITKLASKLVADGDAKNIRGAAKIIAAESSSLTEDIIINTVSSVGKHATANREWAEQNLAGLAGEELTKEEQAAVDKVRKNLDPKKPKKPTQKDLSQLNADSEMVKAAAQDKRALSALAKKFQRAIFENDNTLSRNQLVRAVHKEMADLIPGLTKVQAEEAMAGYGLMKKLPSDTTSKMLRQYNSELRELATLRRNIRGEPGERTGTQRDAPSKEARGFKSMSEARKRGMSYTATDEQLKSAQDRVEAMLNNRITDLDNAIKDEVKIARQANTTQKTAHIRFLERQKEGLQEVYDHMLKRKGLKTGPSDAQRINAAIAGAEKSLKTWKQKMDGTYKPVVMKPLPANQKLDSVRAARDRVKNDYLRSDKAPSVENARNRYKELRRAYNMGMLPPKRDAKGGIENPTADHYRDLIKEFRKAIRNSEAGQKERLENHIRTVIKRISENDFAPAVKEEWVKKSESLDLLEWYDIQLSTLVKNKIESMKPRGIWGTMADVGIAMRYVVAGGELSMIARQAVTYSFWYPKETVRALKAMRKSTSSREYYKQFKDLMLGPMGQYYRRDGLAITDEHRTLTAQEEMINSRLIDVAANLIEKVPVLGMYGKWLKTTEMMFPAYLNAIRAEMYNTMAATTTATGIPTPAEGAQIAHTINVMTGRGGEGLPGFERAVEGLNLAVFAPRFVMSRFQAYGMIAKQAAKFGRDVATQRQRSALDKQLNRMLRMQVGRFAVGVASTYGVLAMGCVMFLDDDDWGVEFDPASSDFLKFRIGNTRVDPWGGFQQAFVFMQRMTPVVGRYKSTTKGSEAYNLTGGEKKFGQQTRTKIAMNFLRSKAAPIINSSFALIDGVNYFDQSQPRLAKPWKIEGDKLKTQKSGVTEVLTPMTYWDIADSLLELGVPIGVAVGAGAFAGWGVQTYEERTSKKKSRRRTR